MNKKKIAAVAGIVTVIATLLHTGASWMEAFMPYETLPEWAIIMTMGMTMAIYTSVLTILVVGITIGLAVGAGYYIGQDVNPLTEHRQLIGAMVAGSVIGTGVYATGMIIYLGGEASLIGFGGWEQSLLVLVGFGSLFFEIGLFVTIAMFAGAALRLASEQGTAKSSPVEAPTDTAAAATESEQQDDPDLTSASA